LLIALTHIVSPNLNACELTHRERQPIDVPRAAAQHAAYCDILRSHGLELIELDVNRDYPDSVFVEDTAVVVDEVAVMARPGAESRRREVPGIEAELVKYREIAHIQAPATLDGGDVLVAGRRVFVGLSRRTNQAGAAALEEILAPLGYRVTAVPVRGTLHLKSAVTAVDRATLLANPDWLDTAPFANFRIVPVAPGEPLAANTLRLEETVYLAAGFEETAGRVAGLGNNVKSVNISELQKAEAGLTCSSIIFRA